MQTALHIATAADSAYVLPLRIMLESLAERISPSFRPVLHFINRGLTAQQIEQVGRIVETHSIVPDALTIGALPLERGLAVEAAFPLLLPDVLPKSVDKVLFLDPDLLILDDIAKVWETDLNGRVIAAVVDQAIPCCSSPRGLKGRGEFDVPDSAPYFNAGVMLIDLDRWRRERVSARAADYLLRHRGDTDFLFQEGVNAVLWNDWLQLEPRWNIIASVESRLHGHRSDTQRAKPGIVHFAGRFKPWRYRLGGQFGALYANHAMRYDLPIRYNTTMSAMVLSVYDRYLRTALYGIEHTLWRRRLI